jgi:hypothetical protein
MQNRSRPLCPADTPPLTTASQPRSSAAREHSWEAHAANANHTCTQLAACLASSHVCSVLQCEGVEGEDRCTRFAYASARQRRRIVTTQTHTPSLPPIHAHTPARPRPPCATAGPTQAGHKPGQDAHAQERYSMRSPKLRALSTHSTMSVPHTLTHIHSTHSHSLTHSLAMTPLRHRRAPAENQGLLAKKEVAELLGKDKVCMPTSPLPSTHARTHTAVVQWLRAAEQSECPVAIHHYSASITRDVQLAAPACAPCCAPPTIPTSYSSGWPPLAVPLCCGWVGGRVIDWAGGWVDFATQQRSRPNRDQHQCSDTSPFSLTIWV